MVRIGFVGFGKRAAGFIDRFRELGLGHEVVFSGVCDLDPAAARDRLQASGVDAPVFEDAAEMVRTTRPDAVIIASYDATHLDCFRKVMPFELPVMVEKPLESSIAKAAEFAALARSYPAPILSAHNMRFAPILNRAREWIAEGRVGTIHSFRFHNNVHYGHGYFRKWMRKTENVGSLLAEKGCHDLDILHWLTGSRTRQVYAASQRFEFGGDRPDDLRCRACPEKDQCRDSLARIHRDVVGGSVPDELSEQSRDLCVYAREIDIHDDDVCLLRLENGAQGTYVQTLYTPYSYKSRVYTLVGGLGILEIDLDETAGDVWFYPRYGAKQDRLHEHVDYLGRNHYNADLFLIRHFYDVARGRAKPACTVEDGYFAVAAAMSAAASAAEDRPVQVPGLS